MTLESAVNNGAGFSSLRANTLNLVYSGPLSTLCAIRRLRLFLLTFCVVYRLHGVFSLSLSHFFFSASLSLIFRGYEAGLAGFQCHAIKIKIKTIQQIKSRIWEMKGGKYTKTLANIWVEGIIRIRHIRGNVLPKFIELCMETPCWSSSR